MKKLFGFTLTEVLITLGVIGVVAAMTIPSLVMKTQERMWLSQFNKVTVSLLNAYKLIYEDYGATSNWGLNDVSHDRDSIDKVVSLFSAYIPQISNEIPQKDYIQYISYDLSGEKRNLVWQDRFHGAYLLDGSAVFITIISSLVDSSSLNGPLVQMTIDVNGLKTGPNTLGKDIFLIYLGRNKPILTGYPVWWITSGYCSVKNPSSGWISGGACANWVLKMRNMDYLHREISKDEWQKVMQWNDR